MTPRQLAGRSLYWTYFAPRGALQRWFSHGGPWVHYQTARGCAAMIEAARKLPVLPPAPASAPELHLMTGKSLWYQTLFFVHSFSQYQDLRPVIHDDGSLRPEHVSELRRILPGARIHSDEEATARLDAHLPTASFPCLRAHRLAYLHLRKITDVHAGSSEWRLFCDSDMLFFRRPDALIDWLARPTRPIHAADVQRSYGYDIELLNSLAGQEVPDRINTGIIGMRGAEIDWEFLEHLVCELTVKRKSSYYLEQALTAILTAGRDPWRLPAEDYVVLPEREEALHPKAVLHHYVAQSKRWYFQHNWRVAQARLSAQ